MDALTHAIEAYVSTLNSPFTDSLALKAIQMVLVTGRKLKASLKYESPSVPPTATMEGIDLLTQGVLTLNKCLEQLEGYQVGQKLEAAGDGATLLANSLLKADRVVFLAGTAFNLTHVELMRSLQLKTRIEAVQRIKEILTRLGKEISLEIY
jgi:hypothetical protein